MGRRDDDDDFDDDDDRPIPRRRKKKKRGGDNTLLYVLLGVVGALLLCLCCGGVGTVAILNSKDGGFAKNNRRPLNNLPANGKVIFSQVGNLTAFDPIDPTRAAVNGRMKAFSVNLQPNKTYVITLISDDFDPYLRLESPTGQRLAEDDDGAGNLNARIIHRPFQGGMHRVIVTSFDGGLGRFDLRVEEAN